MVIIAGTGPKFNDPYVSDMTYLETNYAGL